MTARLDWFTSPIRAGEQEVHIRPSESTVVRDLVHLDVGQSQLMRALLDEVAKDPATGGPRARQALPRGVTRTGLPAVR